MINTIIFDMDGVICHTNPYHSIAFQAFFKKRGLNPSEQEYAAHMYGKSNSYIFSHFLKRTIAGEELQSFEDEKEGLFREIYAEHVDPIAGFQDFLNELVDRKYKLGVATSAPIANMDLILDTLGIRSFFGSTLASEDVTAHKPDPQVYHMSAENLQSNNSECLVFEDSHAGVSAAINAEMKVIGVLSSHSVSDLPPCCKYINSYDSSSLINFISGLS